MSLIGSRDILQRLSDVVDRVWSGWLSVTFKDACVFGHGKSEKLACVKIFRLSPLSPSSTVDVVDWQTRGYNLARFCCLAKDATVTWISEHVRLCVERLGS